MKILKKAIISMLAFLMILTASSALAFANTTDFIIKDITVQPGSNESMMNICWYSKDDTTEAFVQVAKGSEMNGNDFPSSALSFKGIVSLATNGLDSNKVTLTGLSPSTYYVYRVGGGVHFSDIYCFTTRDSDTYNAIFIGDAQIGASGSISDDKTTWEKTLSTALTSFNQTSFILSTGDQIDYSKSEDQYDAFFESQYLRSTPLVPTIGNHETISDSPIYSYHYFIPNESSVYGVNAAGGDYWFRYGFTLYMVLNTNVTDVSQHDAFIGQTIAANPDVTWKIVMFHQSIYSSAEHSTDSSIVTLRQNIYPVIDKFRIDAVLAGHDHCYTRSYQMQNGVPQLNQNINTQGKIVNPTGTIYITAGSSSGSKYYDLQPTPEGYAAVRLQLDTPTFSNIQITGNTFTITTYRVDTMKAVDTYSIVKQTSSGFVDVPDSAWYSPAVKFIADNKITSGTGNYRFSPNSLLTRGQFITLLMKAYGLAPEAVGTNNFNDAGNTYYTGYLAAAKRLGIVQGTGNNNFSPEGNISRQDMFTMLYNALKTIGKLSSGTIAKNYTDENKISSYAKIAVKELTASGIISGSDGKIAPTGVTSRAEMAQVIYNLLSKQE